MKFQNPISESEPEILSFVFQPKPKLNGILPFSEGKISHKEGQKRKRTEANPYLFKRPDPELGTNPI